MSIEFLPFDTARCSLSIPAKSSQRRVEANRRNARKSTGPRTFAGKRRASRNALKHGLCSTSSCLPGECPATYAVFVDELREELQPKTILQKLLLPHIAQLLWRINRLPDAQSRIFHEELSKTGTRAPMSAGEVLARRFSDDPGNGFMLLGRYERGLQSQLLRLMKQYEWLKKNRPAMPPDEEEIYADKARRDAAADEYIASCAADSHRLQQQRDAAAERTQSNPPSNRTGEPQTQQTRDADASPLTKRTHGDAIVRANHLLQSPAAASLPAKNPPSEPS